MFTISGLETIKIPDSVVEIENHAFNCCPLKKVEIPESVTKIAEDAFENCPSYLVIYGKKGSYAETFANEHDIKFEEADDSTQPLAVTLYGDANSDGIVDIADSVLLKSYLLNPEKYQVSKQGLVNSDVQNKGNGINSNDILAIQRYFLKLIDNFDNI